MFRSHAVFLWTSQTKDAVRLDVMHSVLDGADLICLFVWNFALKFYLQGHHQLNGVQGVCTQIFTEGRFRF